MARFRYAKITYLSRQSCYACSICKGWSHNIHPALISHGMDLAFVVARTPSGRCGCDQSNFEK
jgi:hypothetical protein